MPHKDLEKRRAYQKAYKKRYYQENRELVLKKGREYRLANKEEHLKKEREYRKNNKEKIAEAIKKYYSKEENKKKRNERAKLYSQSERGREVRRLATKRQHLKNKSIPEKITITALRTRIHHFLNRSGTHKRSKTNELVGCDSSSLKKYLEKQFQEGMSWDNRDIWDIDHIIPLNFFYNFFDIKKIDIQKIAFHYSNLQPLFKKDNIRKQDNIHIENVEGGLGERVVVDMNNKDYELFVFLITEQIQKKLDILKKNNTIKDIGKITSVVWNKFYKLVDEPT